MSQRASASPLRSARQFTGTCQRIVPRAVIGGRRRRLTSRANRRFGVLGQTEIEQSPRLDTAEDAPRRARNTFPGFRSRWTMSWRCAASRRRRFRKRFATLRRGDSPRERPRRQRLPLEVFHDEKMCCGPPTPLPASPMSYSAQIGIVEGGDALASRTNRSRNCGFAPRRAGSTRRRRCDRGACPGRDKPLHAPGTEGCEDLVRTQRVPSLNAMRG